MQAYLHQPCIGVGMWWILEDEIFKNKIAHPWMSQNHYKAKALKQSPVLSHQFTLYFQAANPGPDRST